MSKVEHFRTVWVSRWFQMRDAILHKVDKLVEDMKPLWARPASTKQCKRETRNGKKSQMARPCWKHSVNWMHAARGCDILWFVPILCPFDIIEQEFITCMALFDCAVSYLLLQLEFVKTSFHAKKHCFCLCISMPSMEFQTSTLHQAWDRPMVGKVASNAHWCSMFCSERSCAVCPLGWRSCSCHWKKNL